MDSRRPASDPLATGAAGPTVNPDSDQLYVWIDALDATDPVRRSAAEGALVAAGDNARPLLLKAIALDDRPLVAARSALLLARLADRTAVTALLDATGRHRDDDVRAVLFRAVADLVDRNLDATARERIVALGRDHDADVRAWSSRALQRTGASAGSQPAVEIASSADRGATVDVGADDLASFAQLAQDAADADVRDAVRQLATGNPAARQRAAQLLADVGARGQRALIQALSEPSIEVRTAAVQLLLQLPTPDASGALLMVAAGGGDGPRAANLRALALRALAGCLTGSEHFIVDDLAELCHDPDRFARAGAAAALARLPGPAAVQALIGVLDDSDPFVVEEAARSLGRIGIPPDAFSAAMRCLERPVARAHAPLLRGFIGLLATTTLDDSGRCDQLRRIARSQLRSGDSERITAALALLDTLFKKRPIDATEAAAIAALLTSRDPDVVRAALAVLASHATIEMTVVANALDRVDVNSSTGIDALVAAVRARLAMH